MISDGWVAPETKMCTALGKSLKPRRNHARYLSERELPQMPHIRRKGGSQSGRTSSFWHSVSTGGISATFVTLSPIGSDT